MVQTLLRIAAALSLCLTLSSCNGFDPVLENLMSPPRLTAGQKEIEEALSAAAVTANPILKYPKSGDYRSAFVFYDLDQDGDEEAIAFYATDSNDYTRACLLDRDPSGQWYSPCEIAGADKDIDFIAFANISGRSSPDIVIGWSNPDEEKMTLGVYTYDTLKGSRPHLNSLLSHSEDVSFNRYLISDLDNDGLDDIFLLTHNTNSSWIKMVSYIGYNVGVTDDLPLSDSIVQFAGAAAGRLFPTDGRLCIFIDELLAGNELVTEVFTMEAGSLTPVIFQEMEQPGPDPVTEESRPSLYEQTRRSNTVSSGEPPAPVCMDVDGDSVVEIPTARPLPGYEDRVSDESERIYLTEFHRFSEDALERVFAGAFNRQAGYRVEFPPEWIDTVTVVNQIENGEWIFIVYNDTLRRPLEALSGELARIRVVSTSDYQDKFLESYIRLCEPRGAFSYYGYVPETPNSTLAVTAEVLKDELFSLI